MSFLLKEIDENILLNMSVRTLCTREWATQGIRSVLAMNTVASSFSYPDEVHLKGICSSAAGTRDNGY